MLKEKKTNHDLWKARGTNDPSHTPHKDMMIFLFYSNPLEKKRKKNKDHRTYFFSFRLLFYFFFIFFPRLIKSLTNPIQVPQADRIKPNLSLIQKKKKKVKTNKPFLPLLPFIFPSIFRTFSRSRLSAREVHFTVKIRSGFNGVRRGEKKRKRRRRCGPSGRLGENFDHEDGALFVINQVGIPGPSTRCPLGEGGFSSTTASISPPATLDNRLAKQRNVNEKKDK